MNSEFKELYDKWYNRTCILSTGITEAPEYIDIINWSLAHNKEAIESIKEILLQGPDHIVYVLDEIIKPKAIKTTGYVPLNCYCSLWLNILNGTANDPIDFYKDYNEYHEYMKDNYIPWNPVKEDDPNITLEEFKQGKRNVKKVQ